MGEVTLLTLFFLGLSYGGTACMFTCMPFLSPILLTNSTNYKQSLNLLIPFSAGRVFTYSMIALVASSSALFVRTLIDDHTLSQMILGSATIIVSFFIIKSAFSHTSLCCSTSNYTISKSTFGYFFMGAGISLNPCIPVMTLITASVYTSSAFEALSYGFIFGIGAISASFLVFGFIFSTMARGIMQQLKQYKQFIQILTGVALFIIGVMTLNGKVSL